MPLRTSTFHESSVMLPNVLEWIGLGSCARTVLLLLPRRLVQMRSPCSREAPPLLISLDPVSQYKQTRLFTISKGSKPLEDLVLLAMVIDLDDICASSDSDDLSVDQPGKLYPHWCHGRQEYVWDDLPPSSPPSDYDPADYWTRSKTPPPSPQPAYSSVSNAHLDAALNDSEADLHTTIPLQTKAVVPVHLATAPAHQLLEPPCHLASALSCLSQVAADAEPIKSTPPTTFEPVKPSGAGRRAMKKAFTSSSFGTEQKRKHANAHSRTYYARNAVNIRAKARMRKAVSAAALDRLSDAKREAALSIRREKQRLWTRNWRERKAKNRNLRV
ncbi:hypothetical protein AAF712_005099 [Marasmius tenuissimus]|uniref:BZIP domain-containing protein n=1 Tax=Marasmius tenuissimus TaxID=585030 RepID=A0ABR3A314_9AGAR